MFHTLPQAIVVLFACITSVAISQTFNEVQTRVVDSTIAFRARITDNTGLTNQPFPALTDFTIQTGRRFNLFVDPNTTAIKHIY